ncbi:F-box/LRR-repeat protein 15 isoform X1 [Palaemon carinicauda]|uniref:F-box/LRR-repeat protein 15 isoform X1 n=1 Tax=Palaemon carinicauda TaxID=392227 RepID=UPI0035B632B9
MAGEREKEPLKLTDLPWDDVIFRHIFPKLSAADLCRLRRVCQEFLELHIQYMASCTHLDLSKSTMTNEVFQKLTSPCKCLRWISVASCNWIVDVSLIQLFNNNPHLLSINLSGCEGLSGAALQSAVVNCKKLTSLYLADLPWLTRGGWQVITLHLAGLQKIDARACWDADDETLKNFFLKFRGLKEVRLSKVGTVSDNSLYFLAHSCQELEVLDVSHCWLVSEDGIKQVVEYCKRLKVLNVEGCRDLSETYLCSLQVKKIKIIPHQNICEIAKKRRRVNYLGLNIQI